MKIDTEYKLIVGVRLAQFCVVTENTNKEAGKYRSPTQPHDAKD